MPKVLNVRACVAGSQVTQVISLLSDSRSPLSTRPLRDTRTGWAKVQKVALE